MVIIWGILAKLQNEFGKSANTIIDNQWSLFIINDKVNSFEIPEDSKSNPDEYKRRLRDGLQRLLGDEYMLSIQNETRFDLKSTLNKIPRTETPSTLNQKAAIIENRETTIGEKVDPTRRLRNATEGQQRFLEVAATQIKNEKITTGTVLADGSIKDSAKNSYNAGLLPADVANYTMLTEGVAIPQETLNAIVATPKPQPAENKISQPPSAAAVMKPTISP